MAEPDARAEVDQAGGVCGRDGVADNPKPIARTLEHRDVADGFGRREEQGRDER